jgi:ubiquinone/menaquinone biosynthesis C-methylase UbiE
MLQIADLKRREEDDGHAERINPEEVPRGILSLHQVRYEFAKPCCIGKKVLDVACGMGYGSYFLAEVASQVTGIDFDRATIEHAHRYYKRSNLTYLVGDAMILPFPKASYDTVVSFETLEHLSDIPLFLGEVCRVLKPNGRYVVSTPIVRKTTRKPKNPHHTVEYSAEDFRVLLERYFSVAELYGQIRVQNEFHYWLQKFDLFGFRHYLPAGIRYWTDRKLGTVPFEEMEIADQKVAKGDLRRAHDLIAVCTL